VEQGEGDSVVAAFAKATDAVAAALTAQRAFAEEPWPEGGTIRVRMALHTGEIRQRDAGNYFGPTIIRCARIRTIGHGGQVLLSEATRDLVVDSLPDGGELHDHGLHGLKDLSRAERIWQLVHPDLPREFPPLRSLGAMPTNLPAQMSTFVGRDLEIASVREAMAEHRLVTLTGTGGCGKTRLALQVAADELDRHADGVWFTELAAVSHDRDIAESVARVFGLQEEFGKPLIDTLAEQLHDLDALLVIDNCEQVLDPAAQMIESLLRSCPRLQVLATSREPLGVAGEVAWRVPSLDEATAFSLFVERARQTRPGFEPDTAAADAIGQIAARLDGIPLAIELAAARVRMMHPTRIAAALDDRFRLLTGGNRTAMARQQTLEASVAWSYDLLLDDERSFARRLSVLHGFTLDAAEAVGCDDDADRFGALDLLARLVDKSLVHVEHRDADPEGDREAGDRYRMVESVRQYLQARLVESGEADATSERHFAYFLMLAEELAPRLAVHGGPHCLARLEAEHDNLDRAMEWSASQAPADDVLRFATALTLFWEMRGHLAKGGRWFARILRDGDDAAPSATRARALWGAAHVALYGDDFTTMAQRAPQALAMAESVGDRWAEARALNTLGFAAALYDPESGRAQLARSIELGQAVGDDWAVADGWKMMTVAYYTDHDESGARSALGELRRVAERLGSGFFLAWYHSTCGYFAAHRGDYLTAQASFELGRFWCRAVGDPSTGGFNEAWSLQARAAQGHREEAAAGLEALLARASAAGSGFAVPEAVTALAEIALANDDAAAACDLIEPVLEALGEELPPVWLAELLHQLGAARRMTGDLAAARAALDAATEQIAPLGNEWLMALVETESGLVARDAGDAARAEDLLHRALRRQAHHDLRPGIAATLDALGSIALDAESAEEAVRCFSAADALRSEIGLATRPVDDAPLARLTARARQQLGDAAFEQHWAEAASLSLSEIIEYVSRARGERKRPASGWASLTPTEERVVSLVAEGLTNPQIAERMFIARGTVKVHLSHVFAKLGVSTRSELAAQATKHAGSAS
jgi:predicted ATPase/DNA-binding CsgD family transcriptional regulator